MDPKQRLPKEPIAVTGIHLVSLEGCAVVLAEIDGRWVEVIREVLYSPFSHIVEPAGMRAAATKES